MIPNMTELEYAVAYTPHRWKMHQLLSGVDFIPRALRHDEKSIYLNTVSGMNWTKWMCRPGRFDAVTHLGVGIGTIDQIIRLQRDHGILLGDRNSMNIMVLPDGGVAQVDLESAMPTRMWRDIHSMDMVAMHTALELKQVVGSVNKGLRLSGRRTSSFLYRVEDGSIGDTYADMLAVRGELDRLRYHFSRKWWRL